MNNRRFNSIMPVTNHIWASDVPSMTVNPDHGPDLIGKDFNVELKFCLVPNTKNYTHWTTLEYQLAYNNGRPCFWGLGTYELDRPVRKIRSSNPQVLESYVKCRELFIVLWDWIYQFNPHEVSGKTSLSEWNHTLRYPRLNAIPSVTKTFNVNKGLVHITQSVPINIFNF